MNATKNFVCKVSGVLLGVILMAGSHPKPVHAETQRFIQLVYDACFDPAVSAKRRSRMLLKTNPRHPNLFLVRFRQRIGYDAPVDFCVYDNVCGQVLHSGRVEPRITVNVFVCRDRNWRGSILVLDKAGRVYRFDDVHQRQTIELQLIE